MGDNFGPEAQGKSAASPPPFNLGAGDTPKNNIISQLGPEDNGAGDAPSVAAPHTPAPLVAQADAPAPADQADGPSPVSVTFGAVRGMYTPVGSPDRIPPRVDTTVSVEVAGWHPPMNLITVEVEGASAANGTLSINRAASARIAGSGPIYLMGLSQTLPGNGGNLRLVARMGNIVVGRSGAFSVSTIQKDVAVSFNSMLTGSYRGFTVDTRWGSDSGNPDDLDELDFSEKVEYDGVTGSLSGLPAVNSGYLPAIHQPLVDSHGAPAGLTSPGTLTAHQVFTQRDNRTGAGGLVVANSGFIVQHDVVEFTPGVFKMVTSKVGAATTARGFASSAGSGNVNPPAQVM